MIFRSVFRHMGTKNVAFLLVHDPVWFHDIENVHVIKVYRRKGQSNPRDEMAGILPTISANHARGERGLLWF